MGTVNAYQALLVTLKTKTTGVTQIFGLFCAVLFCSVF